MKKNKSTPTHVIWKCRTSKTKTQKVTEDKVIPPIKEKQFNLSADLQGKITSKRQNNVFRNTIRN